MIVLLAIIVKSALIVYCWMAIRWTNISLIYQVAQCCSVHQSFSFSKFLANILSSIQPPSRNQQSKVAASTGAKEGMNDRNESQWILVPEKTRRRVRRASYFVVCYHNRVMPTAGRPIEAE
ncbi:Hypothetical_protein [Hexamita inflata]|uniref:Hypothetical_protein n=1 Tax=Hexamita inflata TaxID=28002 RepID=A0AA86PFL5_9EUKA|nr:Hypothetical protein HINF_LOCUS22492 [Hexamita inflata]